MATSEQIERILAELRASHPKELYQTMNEDQAGAGAVMRLLHESGETVTAGKIADFMGGSTARVAVLLKKMAARGLIVKETDPQDARVTIVRLSEKGRQSVEAIHTQLCSQIGNVIDKVGMERMLEFVSISRQIHDALTPPAIEL